MIPSSPHRATRLALAIAAIVGIHSGPLLAADLSWSALGSDSWFDGANWSPASAPTAADNTIIDNGGTAQVQAPGAVTDDLVVGATGGNSGFLDILSGGTLDSSLGVIGRDAGASGTMTVTGVGSLWRDNNFITIGNLGGGSLTIEDAGRVESFGTTLGGNVGGTGTVTVTGAGSTLDNGFGAFLVGFGGDGTLTITEGGQVSVDSLSFSVIGNSLGSTGAVTVSGDGSLWSTGRFSILLVAAGGNGTLSIENGGRVDSLGGAIGRNPGVSGTVSVTGSGSQWNNSQNVFVGAGGAGGDGELTIANGGQVNNSAGVIGLFTGSIGKVTVTGAGSQWNNANDLFVGFTGDATLSIADGGQVDNMNTAIAIGAGSTSTVLVGGEGAQWNSSGDLVVGNQGDATLIIADGGQVSADVVGLAGLAGSKGTLTIGAGGAAGVLDTAEASGGAGNATLNFDHTDTDYHFTRDGTTTGDPVIITGSVSVNHLGGGTTVLSGDHDYTGPTIVDNGTLIVNGAIVSTSLVNTGGTLGGSGKLGNVGFGGAGGTIAPGNSIGTLTLVSIDFASGGVYEVEVDAVGNSDLLNVGGTANLAGGRVSVLPLPGDYGFKRTYTILEAATVNDKFEAVSVAMPEFAFLDPSLAYSANRIDLTLERNDISFASVAETPNQRAVGSRIERLYRDDPESIRGLLNNLFLLDAKGANAAYDALSGVQHTHAQTIAGNLDRQFQSLLFDRLAEGHALNVGHDPSLALSGEPWARQLGFGLRSMSLDPAPADRKPSSERGSWLHSFGGIGDIDATANASGVDYTSGGIAFGVDTELSESIVVGVAAGYAHTDADTFDGGLDIDSYQLAGYAGWARNDSYLSGSLGASLHRTEADRGVALGEFNSRAEADYDNVGVMAALEAGHHLDWRSGARITPFVGIEYSHLDRDGFTETGAGVANLAVEQEFQESLRSRVGLRFGRTFSVDDVKLMPALEAAYVHEYFDGASRLDAGFASVPNATFTIVGPELDRDRIQLGAGLGARFGERISLNVGYQAEFAHSDDWHSLSATFAMRW